MPVIVRNVLPLTLSDGVSSWLDSGHALWVAHQNMWCDVPVTGAVHIGCLWAKGVSVSCLCGTVAVFPILWGMWSHWNCELLSQTELGFHIYLKSGHQHLTNLAKVTCFSDLVKERLRSSLLRQFEVDDLSHVKCSALTGHTGGGAGPESIIHTHPCNNPQARKSEADWVHGAGWLILSPFSGYSPSI